MIVRSLSVVVPVHNGAPSLPELLRRLNDALPRVSAEFEVLLVDDGSRDDSVSVATRLRAQYPFVRLLRLLRNYGQHNALLCGIRHARHDVVVTMDDDLQHPPERIASLIVRLNEGADLVYGFPEREPHGLWRNIASPLTKIMIRHVLGVDSVTKVSGFRAFRRTIAAALDDFKGPFVNLDVMFTWGTTRIDAVVMPLEARAHGASNYSVWKLVSR